MEVKIRRAEEKDLKDIQKLNLELFKHDSEFDSTFNMNWTFSEEGKNYFLDKIKNEFAIVAEIDNKIVGYLVGGESEIHSYRKIKKIAELDNMLVLEEYRGKSIGKKLVDAFLKWCKDNNFERISVEASTGNEKAIRFYKKMGFKDYNSILEMVQ